jgi:hypothetical protein
MDFGVYLQICRENTILAHVALFSALQGSRIKHCQITKRLIVAKRILTLIRLNDCSSDL